MLLNHFVIVTGIIVSEGGGSQGRGKGKGGLIFIPNGLYEISTKWQVNPHTTQLDNKREYMLSLDTGFQPRFTVPVRL